MKKFAFALALLMMPLFMFAGCGGSSESNKIVLSEVTHSIFYAPLYIAMSNNYFADEGLTVELVNGNGSNNVMTSIVSGVLLLALLVLKQPFTLPFKAKTQVRQKFLGNSQRAMGRSL